MRSHRLHSFFALSTCLLTVTFTVYPKQANAKETAKTTPVNPYPGEVVQIFVDSCVSGGQGIDPAVMKKICSCSIEGIQNRYTLSEFIKISDELSANKPMRSEMTQIVQSCAEQAVK
ncbi:hypothetical protein [Phormidesmis priestleyi]